MNSAVVMVFGLAAFLVAYRFYAKHLSEKVFCVDCECETPAHCMRDGVDYEPARTSVLFGHHFASIAGLGPITGPAIAVIWGWLPAVAWIIVGSILLGAVHDFAALALSLKHEGRSIGDLTGSILGGRGRMLFLVVTFFLLALAMGVFALIVGQLFATAYPEAVIPVFGLMVVAVGMGYGVYRMRVPVWAATLVGLALMFLLIWGGLGNPVCMYKAFVSGETKAQVAAGLESGELAADNKPAAVSTYLAGAGLTDAAAEVTAAASSATTAWILILLAYAFVASVLPVWLLLQPRDYLNSYQLYLGVGALFLGVVILHPKIVAPAVNHAEGLHDMVPLLFITVACGAISGFHSLVSSGTTARQLNSGREARLISYGGMLTEGLLALLVVMACAAGIGDKWGTVFYKDWSQVSGSLGGKLLPFFYGAGTFLEVFRIPRHYGEALMAVVVVGFAMTTLDSGTRLLRYNIEEFADTAGLKRFVKRYVASFLAVFTLAAIAFLKVPTVTDGVRVYKPAGIILWQLFGTTNQLLACLGLLVATVFLVKARRPVWYTGVPFAFMLFVTGWSMFVSLAEAWSADKPEERSWPLVVVGGILIVVTAWLALEALLAVLKKNGGDVEAAIGAAAPPEPGSDETGGF